MPEAQDLSGTAGPNAVSPGERAEPSMPGEPDAAPHPVAAAHPSRRRRLAATPAACTAPTPGPNQPEVRALWISRFDLGSPPVKRAAARSGHQQGGRRGLQHDPVAGARDRGRILHARRRTVVVPAHLVAGGRPRDAIPGGTRWPSRSRLAHKRGLALHAYLNAFTFWECGRGAPPHTTPEHPYWTLAKYDPTTKRYDPAWRVYAKVKGTPTPMGDTQDQPRALLGVPVGQPGRGSGARSRTWR